MAVSAYGAPTLAHALQELPGSSAWAFPEQRDELGPVELRELGWRVAAGLRRAGVAPGDVVGLLVGTGRGVPAGLFGSWCAGAAVSVLPLRVFLDDGVQAHLLRRLLDVAGMRHVIVDGSTVALGVHLRGLVPGLVVHTVNELVSMGSRQALRPPPQEQVPGPGDLAVVQFTSGSTSEPKGVMLSHRAFLAGLMAVQVSAGCTADDVFVQWVPHFHDMGLVAPLSVLLLGCRVHQFSPAGFIKRPDWFMSCFADCGGTLLTGPNFAYDLILDSMRGHSERPQLGAWRLAFNGAEKVQAGTVRRFRAELGAGAGVGGQVMYPVYGLAEATLAAAFPDPGSEARIECFDRFRLADDRVARIVAADDEAAMELVSVGRAVHGLEMRVIDGDRRVCGDGELGEVQLQGRAVASGYLRNPRATAGLFDGEWLRSGDLGVVCGGDLFIAGRRRDMVIVNGQNYFPEDIEAAAADVEGVFRRHCVAVADAERERMLVVVEAVRSADARELGAAVRRRVAERTGAGAVDVRVVAPRWLPRTTSGKWQRAAVRRLLAERTPAGGCSAAPEGESVSATSEAQSDTRKETLR